MTRAGARAQHACRVPAGRCASRLCTMTAPGAGLSEPDALLRAPQTRPRADGTPYDWTAAPDATIATCLPRFSSPLRLEDARAGRSRWSHGSGCSRHDVRLVLRARDRISATHRRPSAEAAPAPPSPGLHRVPRPGHAVGPSARPSTSVFRARPWQRSCRANSAAIIPVVMAVTCRTPGIAAAALGCVVGG